MIDTYIVNTTDLSSVADAIRTKTGETEQLTFPAGFISAISSIQNGGSIVNDVESFEQINTTAKTYLAAAAYNPSDYTSSIMPNYEDTSNVTLEDPLGYSLTVSETGKLYLVDEETGKGRIETVSAGTYVVYNLIPGHVYRYLLKGSNDNIYSSGRLKATGDLRMIHMTNCHNFRDMGGWSCDGGKINYGLLLRGAQMETEQGVLASEIDKKTIRDFGILYELDLRDDAAVDRDTSDISDDIKSSCAANYITYKRISLNYHDSAMKLDGNYLSDTVNVLRIIMSNVANGIPTYFHCAAGADRTGTIAVILEALLGVSQSDIDKDYELTSFYPQSGYERLRTNDSYKKQIAYINSFSGDTFRNKCVNWAMKAGFTISEINNFRKAMSDGDPHVLVYNKLTVTTQPQDFTVVSGTSVTETIVASGDDIQYLWEYRTGSDGTWASIAALGLDATSNNFTLPSEVVTISIHGWQVRCTVSDSHGDSIVSNVATLNVYENVTYYTITTTLENCISSNNTTKIVGGSTYMTTLTPATGYQLGEIKVIMGETDISKDVVSNGIINIIDVNNNVSISCIASEIPKVNQLPLATDSSGASYNNGAGYKSGYRLNSSGAEAAQSGYYVTGFIPCLYGQKITFENIQLPISDSETGWNLSYIAVYDSDRNKIASNYTKDWYNKSANNPVSDSSGQYIQSLTMNTGGGGQTINSMAYIRLNSSYIGDDSAIYVE